MTAAPTSSLGRCASASASSHDSPSGTTRRPSSITGMSTSATHPTPLPSDPAAPRTASVEIVLPVYNEERALATNVRTLHEHLSRECAFTWRITIAENASTDATGAIADGLARELDDVVALHLSEKG